MYPDLLEAITHVQYRYLNHWHPNILPTHSPSSYEAAAYIESLDKQHQNFNHKQPTTKNTYLRHRQSLLQILLKKQECFIDTWPQSIPTESHVYNWYIHDRLIYNGFNHILSLIIVQSQTQLDLATCPSLCSLAFDIHWISQITTGQVDENDFDFQWMFKFRIFTQTIPYHVERKKLENAAAHMLPQVPEHETGFALYRSITRKMPQTRQEEKLMVVAMKSIHHLLAPHPTSKADEIIRELIYHLVNSTDTYLQWIMEQLDICLDFWKKTHNKTEHHAEFNFWHNQRQCTPDNIYLTYLASKLTAINENGVNDTNIKNPALTWTLSVKEFIQHFHPMIAKGTITQNGNNDMVPIVTSLHQLFEIPKARGYGNVSCQSLLTYFKNTNAERKDKYGLKIRV